MTRLVLVRHGESMVTVDRVLGGLKTCRGLSPLGVRQAEALRDRLTRTQEFGRVDVLYSSTLPRARETAEILRPALGHVPIIEDVDLCEHDPGEADGMPFEEITAKYGDFEWDREPYRIAIPGSESVAHFHHRVAEALQRIATAHESETVVVSCHGGVIDIAMRSLLRGPIVGSYELWTLNASITEFVRNGPKWRLVRYNDAAHLEGLPADTAATPRKLDLGPVSLREITSANYDEVRRLETWPHQRRFVAGVVPSIAEAHHRDIPAWYRAVYAGDTPVGFVMMAEPDLTSTDPGRRVWYLWRLLIAGRYQRQGYGQQVLDLISDRIRSQPDGPRQLLVSWVPGDGGPEPFYLGYGFVPTGDLDGIEIVARLNLS
jgi:probable phosphoglycerate mutase